MAQLLSSKIAIEEETPRIRTIQGVQTSILLALGVTERGPFTPTLITSFEDFRRIFGGDTADAKLPHALRSFFEEGGKFAYVQRVVHYTDNDDLGTRQSAAASDIIQSAAGSAGAASVTGSIAGPWALTPAGTLVIGTDGNADETVTFDAAAAALTAGSTGAYALADGGTLLVEIDDGPEQTVTFNTAEFGDIGAATALEVAAVINAELAGASADVNAGAVRITSDRKGTGSSVKVNGGTSNAALGFSTVQVDGTGDVSDISEVTFAEVKALIEADTTGLTVTESGTGGIVLTSDTTGASSEVAVNASSTLDDEFGLDNATHNGSTGAAENTLTVTGKTHGAYANDIRILIETATSGETDEFNLSVVEDGITREVFPNLSMDSTSARYVETIVNDAATGSNYVVATDSANGARPENGTHGPLAGGNDGLVGLTDADFIGSSVTKTGMRGFDTVEGNILICPDRATPAVHVAMLAYAENTRNMSMFAVLDPPEGYSTEQMVTYVKTTAGLKNLSEFGAIYYPRVKVLNPNTTIFGTDATVVVPPSGAIAGVYARTDAAREGGIYDAPAGIERGQLLSVQGFENEETKDSGKRDLLYPELINPLAIVNGQRVIDGVRTLKAGGNFPTVAERRGVIFIEQSVKGGLEFARFANNDERLRSTVNRTVRLFLIQQMNVGAFRSRVPAQAFVVNFGEDLNPDSVVFAGKMIGTIGLATQKPAEFIVLRFSQDTRALEQEAGA